MIVDDEPDRSKPLKQSLVENGYEVVAHIKNPIEIEKRFHALKPDVVIIHTESPNRDSVENICVMTTNAACPVMLFADDADKEKIRAATQAGVSAYVVGSIPTERLAPVIDAAVARFEEFNNLREELALTKLKLEERKVVEQAKGLLMRQRNLDEDEAYSLLRSMAMKKNMKLADLSHQLIDAARMLIL